MRKSVASGRQRQVEWSERRANRLGRALACGLLLCWSACASGWKIEDPDRLLPELSREQSRMLRDVNPYVLAFDDLLTPFLCRWRSPATLSVSLDPGASEDDRRVLELALRAWEQAGLGLQFELGPGPAAISVGFATPGGYSGTTRADCAVRASGGSLETAELVHARVMVRRVQQDALGRPVPLTPAERLGTMLHEFGHALGFQGHPRRGATVMLESVDHVRRAGRRLLRGETFRDPALEALYRLPSGTRLGSIALSSGRTLDLDALHTVASGLGYEGPLLRSGDRSAQVAWRKPGAPRLFFLLPDIAEVLRDPEGFRAIPGPGVRALLSRVGATR